MTQCMSTSIIDMMMVTAEGNIDGYLYMRRK